MAEPDRPPNGATSQVAIELDTMTDRELVSGRAVSPSDKDQHASGTTRKQGGASSDTSRASDIMEWMEHNYPELLEELRKTECVGVFQDAEANKTVFPTDEAVCVAKAMAHYLEGDDEDQRKCYVKSLFMCLSPVSLVPLSVELYRVYCEQCPHQLDVLFNYYDDVKVTLLGVELYTRNLLNVPEQAVAFKKELLDKFEEKIMDQMSNDLWDTQLRNAIEATKTLTLFYLAFNHFKDFPQEDADRVAEAMGHYLEGDDEEKRTAYRACIFSALTYGLEIMPVAIAMYRKYKTMHPDKLDAFVGSDKEAACPLGKALRDRNMLEKEEEALYFDQEVIAEYTQAAEEILEDMEGGGELLEAVRETDTHVAFLLDMLTHDEAHKITEAMAKLCLDGDKEKSASYVAVCSSCFEPSTTLSVFLTLRYLNVCPDKLEEFCGHSNEVPSIGRELVRRNLLSDRMQELFLKHTTLSSQVKWSNWGDLAEIIPEAVFRAVLPSIAETVGDFSTFPLGQFTENTSEANKAHLLRRIMEAAILLEGGDLTEVREVARGDRKPEHKLRQACTSCLLKIAMSDAVSENGLIFMLDELLKFMPYTLKMDTEEKCLLELIAGKGLSYTNAVVKLFEKACIKIELFKTLQLLVQRQHLQDYMLRAIIMKQKDLDANAITRLCRSTAYYCFVDATVEAVKLYPLSHEDIFMHVLDCAKCEQVVLDVYDELNPNLYSEKCVDSNGRNPCHIAAEKGYTVFCKQVVAKGYDKLLTTKNHNSQYPVQVCLSSGMYATAAFMLKSMEDWKLCVASEDKPPDVNFKQLIKKLAEMREASMPVVPFLRKPRTDAAHKRLTEDIQDCILAVLDATVDQEKGVIHHEVLEVDEEGKTPDRSTSPSIPSTIEIVAKNDIEAIAAHDSFRVLVRGKWRRYGWKFYMVPLVSFVIFLTFLTTALVLASKKDNPATYKEPLDGFRLFCEIVVFLIIGYDCLLEVLDFWYNYDKSIAKYFTDLSNWLDILAVLFTVLIVPFRFANIEFQWVFAAIAYILHSLRIFEYAVLMSFVGLYVKILIRVIVHDTVQFIIVLAVIMISFGGGLYFALHGEPCPIAMQASAGTGGFHPAANTSLCLHPDETSEIYLTWLTGIRLLVEGSVIEPYIFGEQGLRWLGVIIYFLFLFVVAVILLNLLIAQYSKTYDEQLENARVSVTLERARILIRQRSSPWIRLLFWIIRKKKGTEQGNKDLISFLYCSSSPFIKVDESDEISEHFEDMKDTLGATNKSVNKGLAENKETLLKVRNDLDIVKGELKCQADAIRELQGALRKQTEMAAEQQRIFKEMCDSVKEMIRESLHK